MTSPTYIIRGWNDHFETAHSRKCASLAWIAVPNKYDGLTYRRLMRMADGPAIYCAWILLLGVASKCKVRGVLETEAGPLTAEDISLKTDAPVALIERALEVLSSPVIGWLAVATMEQHPTPVECHPIAVEQHPTPVEQGGENLPTPNRTEPYRTRHNNTEPNRTEPVRKSGGRNGSAFESEDLKDTGKVIAWLSRSGKQLKLDPHSHDVQIHILACAEAALADGEKPIALFHTKVKAGAAGDWSYPDECHAAAKARLRDFRPVKPIAAVASVTAKLGVNNHAG